MNIEEELKVVKVAEVKRINEKLTKRELANMCGVSYNYYVNCTTGFNVPSLKMRKKLEEYISMNTIDVYKKAFELRKPEGKPNDSLKISDSEFKEITNNLVENGVFAGI